MVLLHFSGDEFIVCFAGVFEKDLKDAPYVALYNLFTFLNILCGIVYKSEESNRMNKKTPINPINLLKRYSHIA